ncbi:hypothetical protein DBR45_00435 [Pseudomonas sp. HMWF031]|nr:hypothetical protein DBR45_00435 [Pseudomonas sp. HMWF031]
MNQTCGIYETKPLVGASLLAMDVYDNAPCRILRVALAFFASMLAPSVSSGAIRLLRSCCVFVRPCSSSP